MSKIIGPPAGSWTAQVRCAQPVTGLLGPNRVDGCFSLIEIGMHDIASSKDKDGDWSFTVKCPHCQQTLSVGWQIGDVPLQIIQDRCIPR